MALQSLQILQFSGLPSVKLNNNCVHIVSTELDLLKQDRDTLLSYLSNAEKLRIDRFARPHLKEQFGLARGMLRKLLGYYANTTPETLNFGYNTHGKPFLNLQSSQPHIFFNLAHTKNRFAFAFSLIGRTGIDLEFIDDSRRIESLARYVCSPDELLAFQKLPNTQEKLNAFFVLWTRKEALVKADGRGLSMGLRSINIGFQPGRIIGFTYKFVFQPQWSIENVPSGMGDFKMAIAVEWPNE